MLTFTYKALYLKISNSYNYDVYNIIIILRIKGKKDCKIFCSYVCINLLYFKNIFNTTLSKNNKL